MNEILPFEPHWRTSTRSGGGECVQVGTGTARVLVRDSKDRSGPVLAFASRDWARFVAAIKDGELG
jgi:Domain of unknown function (DUF397)